MKSLQKVGRKAWRKARDVLSRDRDTTIRDASSLSPDEIGVTKDPPLCRNCTRFLCSHRDFGEYFIIAGTFARLKKSAELGCCLCRLLCNAEWRPSNTFSRSPTEGERPHDISPRPEIYLCSAEEDEEMGTNGIIRIKVISGGIDLLRNTCQQHFILLPAQDVEVAMPQTLSNVNSASSVAHIAKSWLEDCELHHSGCSHKPGLPGWKPSRLIYVGRPDESIPPQLCLSSTVPVEKAYITLSHCWGGVKMFRLISTNIADLMINLPLSQLNSVFQDTIDLTRRLGIDYVWIDSLCIIQDSLEDWNHESALMGNIYRCALCNIAATGFSNGSKTFYVQRDPKTIRPEKLAVKLRSSNSTTTSNVINGLYYCLDDYWETGVVEAPLNQRAWFHQERILAPRVLHMGSNQVFWECKEFEACETFLGGTPKSIRSNYKKRLGAITNSPFSLSEAVIHGVSELTIPDESHEMVEHHKSDLLDLWWNTILNRYNQGGLTKFEDKLIAISGVAKEIQKHVGGEYVAGLWGIRFLEQLIWNHALEPYKGADRGLGNSQRPQRYQAPSWSWAAINGPVELDQMFGAEPLAVIIDHNVISTSDSEYGRVIGGYIRIRGPLTRATFVKDDKYLRDDHGANSHLKLNGSCPTGTLAYCFLLLDVRVPITKRDGEDSFTIFPIRDAIGGRTFWLLPILGQDEYLRGLILLPSGSGIRGEYRRIGIFHTEEGKWFQNLRSPFSFLNSQEYETYDEGGYTISIV